MKWIKVKIKQIHYEIERHDIKTLIGLVLNTLLSTVLNTHFPFNESKFFLFRK